MKNGWTGGQYSVFRIVFAAFLLAHFLALPSWNAASVAGIASAIFLGMGIYDRAAALALLGLWMYPWLRAVPMAGPRLPLVAVLLLAHVLMPAAPYGSWAARGRVDPGGGWRMPSWLLVAAWIVLALVYIWIGCAKFLGRIAFFEADWGFGVRMLHLFAFDPGWIRPSRAGTERLFYDGHCGLCQRSVRLILAEDATGSAFRFAPLQGEMFQAAVSERERAALPLSLVVQTEKGTLLTRSAGVLHILRRLGGWWRVLAGVLILLPAPLRNALYDGVARVRLHLFAAPPEVCPLMTPDLRARFDP